VILIRAYNKKAKSSPITGPISHSKTTEHIQAFVDDSHGLIIHNTELSYSLQENIQHNMQSWEELLHRVGGKLEISKCRVVRFSWDKENPELYPETEHNQNNPITIRDQETQNNITIPEISTSTPYKLLGINMAFDGSHQAQAQLFRDK
jgi:hypothetical protein